MSQRTQTTHDTGQLGITHLFTGTKMLSNLAGVGLIAVVESKEQLEFQAHLLSAAAEPIYFSARM